MTPIEDVQKWLASIQPEPETELIGLNRALGFRCVSDVFSQTDVPGFDCSSMDGYAVSSVDLVSATPVNPVHLADLGCSGAAGSTTSVNLGAAECVKIMTGAPIPSGADAVVKIEDVKVDNGKVLFQSPVGAGQFIRCRGSNIAQGQKLLNRSAEITSEVLASLLAAGCSPVEVYRKPKIGLLSSGDELVAWDKKPRQGQIRDVNTLSLTSLLAPYASEIVDYGIVVDDVGVLVDKLDDMANSCDVIITSGAVSMGDYDIVKELSVEVETLQWFQVAMKPGKPLVAGQYKDKAFFGLPGNPVSARVSAELFVKPILTRTFEQEIVSPSLSKAKLTASLESPADGKVRFFLGSCSINNVAEVCVTPKQAQESHQTSSLASNGVLIKLQPGTKLDKGAFVEIIGLEGF